MQYVQQMQEQIQPRQQQLCRQQLRTKEKIKPTNQKKGILTNQKTRNK